MIDFNSTASKYIVHSIYVMQKFENTSKHLQIIFINREIKTQKAGATYLISYFQRSPLFSMVEI